MESFKEWVSAFASRMANALERNRHKGDRDNWLGDHPDALLRRVRQEVEELETAIASGASANDVWGEAADVANMAAMAADSYVERHKGRTAQPDAEWNEAVEAAAREVDLAGDLLTASARVRALKRSP